MWRPQRRARLPPGEVGSRPASQRDYRYRLGPPIGANQGRSREGVRGACRRHRALWLDSPVTLPPGRARLATMAPPTRSAAVANTNGIVDVACFAARGPGVL